MPGWITLDLGIGAVGGSIVAGAVAVYIDHRKRRDERKNRDRDKKQQAYKQFAVFVGLYFDELMLMVDIWPIVSRAESGTADATDLKELREVRVRADATLQSLHESIQSALTEIDLLAPKYVHEAALDVFEICWTVTAYIERDAYEEANALQGEFAKRLSEFRAIARRELGVRE
jgi:hypothetical protein